jgi:formate dehydrogenase iron-sulfur subunit
VNIVYVPRDSSARSVGADGVARAIQQQAERRGEPVQIIRNGSRGMMWLEPLVEVVCAGSRVAYGPVTPGDVASLFEAGFLNGGPHELGHGRTEAIAWLAQQDRLTFARVGVVDPASSADYQRHGGLVALRRALGMTPEQICEEVTASGLRGRGGAGFPVGVKWRTVLEAPGSPKFVVCNADEGDAGTFADRMLMEGDPFMLIESMVIAGIAVGAREGFIYIRSEYPDAVTTMKAAIASAYQCGWLGRRVLDSDHRFDLQIRVGAGAYICGEETAMLESLEGKRGMVRAKPPLPALQGLFGMPTAVNNVLSLASAGVVLARGADFYAGFGVGRSRGTQVFQLAGNIARAGIIETAFGITLAAMLERFGGGTASGRPIRAVQVGGPLGAYLPPARFDLRLDYESFAAAGAMVGHGGIVVFDQGADMGAQARFAMEFCAAQSCGRCTPCRIGAVRGVEVIDEILAGREVGANIVLLKDLCEVMSEASLCAMGAMTPIPVRSVLQYFPQDLDRSERAPR